MNQSTSMPLDGLWQFSPDPHGDGESLGFWRREYNSRPWLTVPVPSCFEAASPDIEFYTGVCWYRRAFHLPEVWKDRSLVLRFEAVNYRAKVWLNGALLGENRDGFLPFEFEVRDKVIWDRENIIAVAVDNAHHEGDVPGKHVGWRPYGGITREVSIRATELVHLKDIKVIAEPHEQGGELDFVVRVTNGGVGAAGVRLAIAVRDAGEKVCAELESDHHHIGQNADVDIVVKGAIDDVREWTPSSPVLYSAGIRLMVDGRPADEREVRFGFRVIDASPGGLFLNGKPIFLTGFNRHEDSPRKAMAVDLETARQDFEAMKKAGANFVRLCHYPHHPGELDLCDELGLLAFCEVPLYFWSDPNEGRRTNAERVRAASRQMERMIARDFNHPSIIFWSVSNETQEEEPDVARSNRELIRLARELDPTRLCVHVSNRWIEHPEFEEDDVLCVNYYPSISMKTRGHNPATFDLDGSAEKWRASLAKLHGKHPDKPVLVTEFGYCSFAGTHGNAFGEDEHAKVLEKEFSAFDAPYVCGAAIWCWADHPWPPGQFLGGLGISPFGVVSRDRRKLLPYWKACDLFLARQGMNPSDGSGKPTASGDGWPDR